MDCDVCLFVRLPVQEVEPFDQHQPVGGRDEQAPRDGVVEVAVAV